MLLDRGQPCSVGLCSFQLLYCVCTILLLPVILLSRQLLIDCGFRSGGGSEEDGASCAAVSQHRALVFCQLKSMLDILENDLLKYVQYLHRRKTVHNTIGATKFSK